MRATSIGLMSAILLLLLTLPGCREREAEQLAEGLVTANQSFQAFFGPPPQGEKGRAFARVGFLPLRETPDKVRPLPLFLFTENNQLLLILERLLSREMHLSPSGPLFVPFPQDLDLTLEGPEGDRLTLQLTSTANWLEQDRRAAGIALAETVFQFPEWRSVRILWNGEPLPGMPAEGYSHQAERIVDPGPPRLILIAGAWENDAADPEELLVEFDRPVKVENFTLRHASGEPVKGEYFTSIFEMAVIVHPENPSLFREGTPLQAQWQVEDALGRRGSGTANLPMQRFEH